MDRCEECEKTLQEIDVLEQRIKSLQQTVSKLIENINKCSCLGFENQNIERICDDCLYFAPGINLCWGKDEPKYWSDSSCCRFIDYEKWFEKHGVKK